MSKPQEPGRRNDLADWVSLAEAASRLPCVRPGKSVSPATVYKIAQREGLEIGRFGRWRYVRWEEILKLFTVELPSRPAVARQPRRAVAPTIPKWVQESLKRQGLWCG